MTISSETARNDYNGNDVTVEFAIEFYFLIDADIRAVLYNDVTDVETELEINTHYTLAGAGAAEGGTLTMVTAPTSDETLTILRDLAYTQEIDYVEHSNFPADSHERAIDKLTMLQQQINEKFSRTIRLAPSSILSDIKLPNPIEDYFLRWGAGDALQNFNIYDLGLYTVSVFIKTLLDDANASAAQTTLGVSDFIKTLLDDADASAAQTTLGISTFIKTLLDDADASAAQTTLGISTFIKTLLDDADAATAQTTLGISAFIKTLLDDADAATGKTTLEIADDPVAGTAGLRTLGEGAQQACAGNNGRLYDSRPPTNTSVSQVKLKTSTQSQSYNIAGSASHRFTLTGGQYCFKVTCKGENANICSGESFACTTSYATHVGFKNAGGSSYDGYCLHRYITSSGEINWLFILRDKITKEIIGRSIAPDHSCFGNGGEPLLAPHPFGDYDEIKYEIIVINPTNEEIEQIELEAIVEDETKPDKDLLEVIAENYEINEGSNPAWPSIPVTVGLPKHIVDKKTGKKVLADYRFMPAGTVIEPIKKVIPKPDYIKVRSLKKI
jgi:hypothetical protein